MAMSDVFMAYIMMVHTVMAYVIIIIIMAYVFLAYIMMVHTVTAL